MKKIIKLGFVDKKLERRAPFPLVASDKNAYLFEVDTSKYRDAEKIFIYAKREDGEVVYDSFNVNGEKNEIILKQSIYSVPGKLLIRFVLRSADDTILTAAELCCEVYPGVYDSLPVEDVNTVEECVIKLLEMSDELALKADKEYVDAVAETLEAELNKKADAAYVDETKTGMMDALSKTANALKGTASGEVVCIDEVSPITHTVNVKVKSKNMIPFPFMDGTRTSGGITFTANSDQTITINGTRTTNTAYSYTLGLVKAEKGKMYTFSHISNFAGNEYFYITIQNKAITQQTIACARSKKSVTFVAEYDGYFNVGLVVYANTVYDNVSVAIQLEEGDTATEFAPNINPAMVSLTVYGVDETDNLQRFEPSNDAIYKIEAISPVMNFNTDTKGSIIEVEYNQDVNEFKKDVAKCVAQLRQAIIELGGTV